MAGLKTAKEAVEIWNEVKPAVEELAGVIAEFSALYPGVGTVVGAVYSLYTAYRKNQENHENQEMAKTIIKEIVTQVGGMIKRAQDEIFQHFDEDKAQDAMDDMVANHNKVKEWLSTVDDPGFAAQQADMAVRCFMDTVETVTKLGLYLDKALKNQKSAQAAVLYRSYIDAVQLQIQIDSMSRTKTNETLKAHATAKLNVLIDYHSQVVAMTRADLQKQFYGPVKMARQQDSTMLIALPHGRVGSPRPTVETYSYFYRGQEVREFFDEKDYGKIRTTMNAHVEKVLQTETEKIQLLERDHRNALEQIQSLT